MNADEPGYIIIKFKDAVLTRNTEMFGEMDPFCVVKFGKLESKTKTHQNGGKHPFWNETLKFRRETETKFEIEVYDEEDLKKHDLVGNATVQLQKYLEKKFVSEQIKIFYNVQAGVVNVEITFDSDRKFINDSPIGQHPIPFPELPKPSNPPKLIKPIVIPL